MERRGAETRAKEEEIKRASQWEKTRQLALILSAPPVLQPDGTIRKPTIDEALARVSDGEIISPATQIQRFRARTELRKFIEILINPDGKVPEEIQEAKRLFREISNQYPKRVIKLTNLYEVLGIEPLKSRTSSLSDGIQSGIIPSPINPFNPLSTPAFVERSSLPQPQTGPERPDVVISVFVDNLLFLGENPQSPHLGRRTLPKPTRVSTSPLNNRK